MSMSTTVISQFFSFFLFSIWTSFPVHLFIIDAVHGVSPSTNSPPHSDAVSLLSFKSKADLGNKLVYDLKSRFDYCQWSGVKCLQGRVIRFVLQDYGLRGAFAANTLSSLDQLRVLSLHNNSLVGPIPDVSGLVNLRSLFLSRNCFTGAFPPSITTLHRLQILDISYNNFSGSLPATLFSLERLISLRLEWNFFNGSVPSLNQSFLENFNVSVNNLSGQIPVTPTLSRFGASAFSGNPALCGEIINKECYAHSPFFKAPNSTPPSEPPIQIVGSESEIQSSTHEKRRRNTVFIVGLSIGVVTVIVAVLLCLLVALRGCKTQNTSKPDTASLHEATTAPDVEIQVVDIGLQSKATKEERVPRAQKNGTLIFCRGEEHLYTLEQLMRASAEFLGRGSIGTTYKAAIGNQLIVTVKRLDAAKTATPSGEMFEKHMSTVGGLCHPNLVPVRAYFQAKGERLVIYDYQPNGSLFSLIHGSRSTRSKPLHWTSCLKIADDVAQGIAYIHQATSLVHGNLKSSNVLLGADFEARLTDYSLNTLVESSHSQEDVNSMPPKAILGHNSMQKVDVYAYGVLLLELLTGKQPSQHPYLELREVPDWVRTMREEEDGGESHKLSMLVEVATIASFTSPEQRPEMWQVLQMIQEIKESLMTED